MKNLLEETRESLASKSYDWADIRSIELNEKDKRQISIEKFKELANFDYNESVYADSLKDARTKASVKGITIFMNDGSYFERILGYDNRHNGWLGKYDECWQFTKAKKPDSVIDDTVDSLHTDTWLQELPATDDEIRNSPTTNFLKYFSNCLIGEGYVWSQIVFIDVDGIPVSVKRFKELCNFDYNCEYVKRIRVVTEDAHCLQNTYNEDDDEFYLCDEGDLGDSGASLFDVEVGLECNFTLGCFEDQERRGVMRDILSRPIQDDKVTSLLMDSEKVIEIQQRKKEDEDN